MKLVELQPLQRIRCHAPKCGHSFFVLSCIIYLFQRLPLARSRLMGAERGVREIGREERPSNSRRGRVEEVELDVSIFLFIYNMSPSS
jgi:hypothetical protein